MYKCVRICFRHIQQYLSELLYVMAEQKNLQNVSYLTKDIHVWPDFHGNRSPLADPTLKGMVLRHLYLSLSFMCLENGHNFILLSICILDIWIILICGSGEPSVIILSSNAGTNGMS